MSNAISFEPIQPWNGVTGSGKDARLALDRNFNKIIDEFERIDSDKVDKTTGFVYLGPADITAMPGVFGPNDRVYYVMLVPKGTTELPNFGITQINLDSDAIFQLYWSGEMWSSNIFPQPALDEKADITWVTTQLSSKLSVIDLVDIPLPALDYAVTEIECKVVLQNPNTLNGASEFYFKVMPTNTYITQQQTFGNSIYSRIGEPDGDGGYLWNPWLMIAEDQKGYTLNVDFTIVEAFTFNVPAAMKFSAIYFEGTQPTLSHPLGTALARFDKLVITPATIGLVTLTGTFL